MLGVYLEEHPSVTDRLLAGTQAQDERSPEARTQARLAQWEAQFGSNATIDRSMGANRS